MSRLNAKALLFAVGMVVFVCAGMRIAAALGRYTRPQQAASSVSQAAEYEIVAPKSIVELQQFRQTTSLSIKSAEGVEGTATLINLNPVINTWYLLTLAWKDGSEFSYHIENPQPHSRKLILNPNFPSGIEVWEGKKRCSCTLFGAGSQDVLAQARDSQLIYAPLCDGRFYIRNPAKGHRTSLEAAADFLRNQVWAVKK